MPNTTEFHIRQLNEMIKNIQRYEEMVRRKRKMRDSEKAMTLASYAQDREALQAAIVALSGKPAV